MLDFFLDDFYTSNELLNTKLQELEFCILDFETTGLYPYNGDRIIEIGIVRCKYDQIAETYETFINPDMPIPEAVFKINKISDDMVKNAPLIDHKIEEVVKFLKNSVIVAHNLSFDLSFLNYQLQKMNRPKINSWFIDTIKVAKALFPELEKYSLERLTKALKIENREAHRALTDAEATFKILVALMQKLPNDAFLKDLLPFKIH